MVEEKTLQWMNVPKVYLKGSSTQLCQIRKRKDQELAMQLQV